MPDISMCPSITCHLRKSCYRNEASGTRPGLMQSYFVTMEPDKDGKCDRHWPFQPSESGNDAPEIQE